jgi:propanol-preferring alcohol dehydrogenase
MEAASTCRAMQAVSRGRLELTEKTIQAPGPGKVRIRVEACGVCHPDFRDGGSSIPDRMAARPRP